MTDKYLNIDLHDERASAIAEVMTNKTCRKILDLLAEKEMSESELAAELNIPLNTIGYNMKKLLDAGLIEKTKSIFWSVKGKRIPTYRLANKKILISPRRISPAAIPAMVLGGIVAGLLIIALIAQQSVIETGEEKSNSEGLKQFSSLDELQKYIKEHTESYSYGYGGGEGVVVNALPSAASSGKASAESAVRDSARASEFSTTNIQVEGVDEPDIVKNDGKYIYTLSGDRIVIVDAFPVLEMQIVSEINASGASNIFIRGDDLVVLGTRYSYTTYDSTISSEKIDVDAVSSSGLSPPCYGIGCRGYSAIKTTIEVYDISDRANPFLKSNITLDGSYADARMIEEHIYVISSEYINNNRDSIILPAYSVNGVEEKVAATSIYYPEIYDEQFTFTSILALDLEDEEVATKTYLTGATSTIYVSENNIYLTSLKRLSVKEHNERSAREVILPLLPTEEQAKIEEVLQSGKESYEQWNTIWQIVQNYSQNLRGDAKESFDSTLQKGLQDFSLKIQKESKKTVIHKISVDDESISYENAGEVIGHVLNQFSLDEFEGKLRIATTTGEVWNGNSLNHLFVLDEEMNLIGSVEDLAPGEKIYSVRFMGERAYIVTFKKVDPFYVIDLSLPSAPKVLGYLKIPGYSDYLHPYNEDYIIGLGKNARGGGENFAYYQGLKLSLFDVRDVANPKEVATIEIGDRGTDSFALHEHKAFLFDRERNLLVIPVQLAKVNWARYEEQKRWYQNEDDWKNSAYGEQVWQGAYVFKIDEENISLRGQISHYDGESTLQNGYEQQWYYDYRYSVQRSLFMDDVLYTISQSKVKAHQIDDLAEINRVRLPYQQDYRYGFLE